MVFAGCSALVTVDLSGVQRHPPHSAGPAAGSSACRCNPEAPRPVIIFQDELRARPRHAGPTGVPVLTEDAAMIASYLAAGQDLGRIAADPTWTRSRLR